MARGRGGFIGQDGLNAPDSPTGVSASAGDAQATVSFTAPTDVGASAITGYRAQSNPSGIGASGSSSPITVTGLSNGTAYTFNVWAINAFGYSAPSDASTSVAPAAQVALIAGANGNIITVDSFSLASATNAVDFGDLTLGRYYSSGAGSGTRFICCAGDVSFTSNVTMDYTTYASTGTFSDFGDANVRRSQGNNTPITNGTRSVIALPTEDGVYSNNDDYISYITNASTGDAVDFGNLNDPRGGVAGLSNNVRGFFGGGYRSSNRNSLGYVTIASTGNEVDTGSLTVARNESTGCASSTRGLFCGGGNYNTIDYVTISSGGNATDFGDLGSGVYASTAVATSTKAVITRGSDLDQVTIASTGNATDWGADLTISRTRSCGGSNTAAQVQ